MHVGRTNPPVPPAQRQQNNSAHDHTTSVIPSATTSPPGSITNADPPLKVNYMDLPPLPPYNPRRPPQQGASSIDEYPPYSVVMESNKPPQHLDDDEFDVRVM